MLKRITIAHLGIWGVLSAAAAFAGTPEGCKLRVRLEIPVTVQPDLRPVTNAQINGHDVAFVVDSGAFFSMLSPSTAAELKLHLQILDSIVSGISGQTAPPKLTSATLTLGGATFPKESEFVVAGNEFGESANGLLGQNVLRVADVEYDLANGVVRLIKPEGDCRTMMPTYWAKPGDAFSVMDISWATRSEPHTIGIGYLNGEKIRMMFDTGAGRSLLSLQAAENAGIKTNSPGVIPGGVTFGVGRGTLKTWIAPFQSFKIGGEEIRNTHLRIGELQLFKADMIVGADFFLSHRVYVASSEHKIYFTYNGGPVFNLAIQPSTSVAANRGTDATGAPADPPVANSNDDDPGASPPAGSGAGIASNLTIPGNQPTTADEFSRRGAAYIARRDYTHALSDLQRACEMNPREPDYFLERATAYWYANQKDLADADIDTVLTLKPDDPNALFWRARRETTRHDTTAAIADLDTLDRTAAPQDNLRMELGRAYLSADAYRQAIKQYDMWIAAHGQDIQLLGAYTLRCGARALWGQELDQAIADCEKTLHVAWNDPEALASRGLVYLRSGHFKSAISDFSAALKQRPKDAWALYGRGLAESNLQKTADAQADFNAASAIKPHIAEDFFKHGIAP